MTSDRELEITLELARAAREPRAADRRRVLKALRRRVQQSSQEASAPRRGRATREDSGVYPIPRLPFWNRRFWGRSVRGKDHGGRAALPQIVWVSVAMGSVAMGAVGFWLGSRASSETASRELVHWLVPSCH